MNETPRELPPEAREAWQCYQDMRHAKHQHRITLSNPISTPEDIQQSLKRHEQCIAEFRQASKKLQQENAEAHQAFLHKLATEPDE